MASLIPSDDLIASNICIWTRASAPGDLTALKKRGGTNPQIWAASQNRCNVMSFSTINSLNKLSNELNREYNPPTMQRATLPGAKVTQHILPTHPEHP